jgi:hypothetical protein
MTAQELETKCNELIQVADALASQSVIQGNPELKRFLSGVIQVLANTAKTVSESKTELEQIAEYQRDSDRTASSRRDERAIQFFAKMKPEDRERLVRAVETATPNISVKSFAQQIAKEFQSLERWYVESVLEWVGSWYSYLGTRDNEDDVSRVARYLVEPFPATPATAELLRIVDAANPASNFFQQLKRLLRCQSTLGVSHKAETLLARNERQFQGASVSTDLRPIYGPNVEAAPVYGVVLHNLNLRINDGGQARSLGISLTTGDILSLAEVLDRAYKKDRTVRMQGAYRILPLDQNV